MEPYELYYMYPVLRADPAGTPCVADGEKSCRIGDYTIRALPFRVSERQKKYLIGGNALLQELFRFFCLRKKVKGKTCVVLSEKMQALLPAVLWYPCMKTDFPTDLQEAYALQALTSVLQGRSGENSDSAGEQGRSCALMVTAPSEGFSQELLTDLLQIMQKAIDGEKNACNTRRKNTRTQITDLMFFTDAEEEKEWIEDKMDDFLEETGVAGMCYLMETETAQMKPDRPGMRSEPAMMTAAKEGRELGNRYEKAESYRVLLDFAGRPLRELWNIDIYIDAGGRKSGKEIRRLKGRRISAVSLRNYLDRAFYPTL